VFAWTKGRFAPLGAGWLVPTLLLTTVRRLRRSTIRNYSTSVAAFCDYITSPAYEWVGECEQRFGTHPVQVVHDWNTAVHVQNASRTAQRNEPGSQR